MGTLHHLPLPPHRRAKATKPAGPLYLGRAVDDQRLTERAVIAMAIAVIFVMGAFGMAVLAVVGGRG